MSEKLKAYIGIDPGNTGASCLLVPENKHVEFMGNSSHPVNISGWYKGILTQYNLQAIMIEKVQNIQGTSSKSNFKFGYNVGLITGIAQTTGGTFDLVTPTKWQRYIGVKPKDPAIKKTVASIAERLYPHAVLYGPRGGLLDGRSDALMIAHYASHLYNQST